MKEFNVKIFNDNYKDREIPVSEEDISIGVHERLQSMGIYQSDVIVEENELVVGSEVVNIRNHKFGKIKKIYDFDGEGVADIQIKTDKAGVYKIENCFIKNLILRTVWERVYLNDY
jgi:hypothetical protein